MLFWARVILLLVDVGVRSSAYPVRETPGGVAGGSDRYKLKRAGERTLPCGTPVLMFSLRICIGYIPHSFVCPLDSSQ